MFPETERSYDISVSFVLVEDSYFLVLILAISPGLTDGFERYPDIFVEQLAGRVLVCLLGGISFAVWSYWDVTFGTSFVIKAVFPWNLL